MSTAARVAGFRRALEQLARLRSVGGNAGAGSVEHAEFDHGRRASLVGRLAPDAYRFRQLPVDGVGAAELIKRASRRAGSYLAIFDRGRDIGWSDIVHAFDVGRLVRIGMVGGDRVAEHQINRLRLD